MLDGHPTVAMLVIVMCAIIVAILAARVVMKVADILYQVYKQCNHGDSEQKRYTTLIYAVAKFAVFLLWIIVVIWVGSYVGVPTAVLTMMGTVLGAGIGFGSQSLVADIIKGVVRVMERQASVGDLVTVKITGADEVTGTVSEISILSLKMTTDLGEAVNIPHSSIITIRNLSKVGTFKISVESPLEVGVDRSMEIVTKRVEEFSTEHPEVFLTVKGVVSSTSDAVEVQVQGRTEPSLKYSMEREVRQSILAALQEGRDDEVV